MMSMGKIKTAVMFVQSNEKIYVVYFEGEDYCAEGYYAGLTDCERYATTTLYISEAVIFDDYTDAYKVVEEYGGKVIGYDFN